MRTRLKKDGQASTVLKNLVEQNTTSGTETYAHQLVNDIKELKAKSCNSRSTPDMMLTGAVDLLK